MNKDILEGIRMGIAAAGSGRNAEYLAFLLWKHEAERAAPNVAKNRTMQSFVDQSPETVQIWMGFANVALGMIRAISPETIAKGGKNG
jgi:hypothetical protein